MKASFPLLPCTVQHGWYHKYSCHWHSSSVILHCACVLLLESIQIDNRLDKRFSQGFPRQWSVILCPSILQQWDKAMCGRAWSWLSHYCNVILLQKAKFSIYLDATCRVQHMHKLAISNAFIWYSVSFALLWWLSAVLYIMLTLLK